LLSLALGLRFLSLLRQKPRELKRKKAGLSGRTSKRDVLLKGHLKKKNFKTWGLQREITGFKFLLLMKKNHLKSS